MHIKTLAVLCLVSSLSRAYHIRPFKIDLTSRVSHLNELVQKTKLPDVSDLGSSGAGIALSWLKDRRVEWTSSFDWRKEQSALNRFNHSTVNVGNMTLHFIHQVSTNPNAIPVILTHGWPGSFYEFNQVITPLSNPGKESNLSFHVVVPSLPGFGFSSPAPIGWTINNTASLFDMLMNDVLGYKSYSAVGGDWGSAVTWALQNNHADHVKAVLYTGFIPHVPPSLDSFLANPRFANQTALLSPEQKQRLVDNVIFGQTGNGYFIETATRPATIGLALYDNPIGQLAWMGEKFLELSDPQYGVPPSTITNNTILTAVSIYYLTRTFETAGNIYFQNPTAFQPDLPRAVNRMPMGFASYKYEVLYYPEFYVAEVGNLVFYANHIRGGHFSALDNPVAYVGDIRTMMGQWYIS